MKGLDERNGMVRKDQTEETKEGKKTTEKVRRNSSQAKKVMDKESPQKKLSRMGIQQSNNEEEESGEIKNEGQPNE